MSFEQKGPASASNFEVDPRDLTYQPQHQGTIRLLNGIWVGLTALALVSGITILGTSANAILVYNNTHVSSAFNLHLWPEAFDLRPTVAQVIGSSIIILASLVSLIFSKVQALHNQRVMHTSLTFIAPFVGFVAALVSIAFFYAVNASSTVDTLQSWTCRWSTVNMRIEPYFGTLCRQSQTALYLSVVLVPVELVVLAAAGAQMSLERKASVFVVPARKPSMSPALS